VTYGLSRAAVVVALAAGLESTTPGSIQRLEVALPSEWRQAARVVLVLEDVTTPRGQAFVVRLRATTPGKPDVPLGSFGVLADDVGAAGDRPPTTYRVDVTRGLRRWGESQPAADSLKLALVTVDGRSKPLEVSWHVGRACLETR
jgi:hypothetical protein